MLKDFDFKNLDVKCEEVEGAYTVVQRACIREPLFHSYEDADQFVVYMERYKDLSGDYCAFSFAWDRFELTTNSDQIPLLMEKLKTAYSSYYNNRYKHRGPIFSNRYAQNKMKGVDISFPVSKEFQEKFKALNL